MSKTLILADDRWCSGLQLVGESLTRCKHGHSGPGMSVCKGIRYTERSLAPCERDDLVFNLEQLYVDGWETEKDIR